jgi:prepilin peptidase CpaA
MPTLFATALALAFAALVVAAAVKDAFSFTIPNWIPLGLAALFPAAALASGASWPTLAMNLGVGAAALVLGMVAFALRWAGGGDAKLLAAVALWLGWPGALAMLLGTAVAGGALALMLVGLRAPMLRHVVLLGPRWVTRLADPGEGVPYGVAIAIGALMALPGAPLGAHLVERLGF